jgi:hypothetical protein
MRTLVLGAALSTAGLTVASAPDVSARDNHEPPAPWVHRHDVPAKFTVALWGDMPYGALGKQQYPNLLADVNAAHVAFSMYDGDLKSGGDGGCTDENLYTPALDYFATLERPLVWVPGDNDWTDCWGRYGEGTYTPGFDDPLERLEHERDLFASTPFSLGQHKLRLTRQSEAGGEDALYRENVRFKYGPVVFLGLNVQGSNDNYPYTGVDGETRSDEEIERMRSESLARRAANLRWLAQGFAYAKSVHAAGVMIVWQTDPNFNNEYRLADTRSWDAFPAYVDALRNESLDFSGQVALIHGDAHYFKLDKPLSGPKGGVVANFTRVETFGARNTHWVLATIDLSDPNLFRFEPRIVPENVDD